MKQTTLGVIVGNRGFFPDHLCSTGRQTILKVLEEEGIRAVILPEDASKFGSVESLADARTCANLFKQHADEIDGILVTLPNFGDEKAVANTIRWSGLAKPVLVHAFADDSAKMKITDRRDSFCGKMSVCNNLTQYNIEYSLTADHTVDPQTEGFRLDLRNFAGICRVVNGLDNLRLGQIGARPAAFNTVRYSEKLLEAHGISVETVDLSEITGRVERLAVDDKAIQEKLHAVKAYTETEGVPDEALLKMAKLGVVIDNWMAENELTATAIQCWTAMEDFYGVVPCTLMSMMSNKLISSACETDIGGLLGMHIMQLASGTPSALLDWNNNYGSDPNKGVMFHCANLPKHFFNKHKMAYQEIIAGTVGKDNTYGTIIGRIKASPFTYLRISTDDMIGDIGGYLGHGQFTDDPLESFGGYGVFEIPELQDLLRFICKKGYEHHVAINLAEVSAIVDEALNKYMDWDIYCHV